jgi:DNA end-binding protein Ku
MFTLRTADEVRQPEFGKLPEKVDAEMVAMAEQIVGRLSKKFDPTGFRDAYQDALRELVAAKLKGKKLEPARVAEEPSNVVDLMAALKRSVEAEGKGGGAKTTAGRARKSDPRQRNLLLPVKGGGKKPAAAADEAKPARRRKA